MKTLTIKERLNEIEREIIKDPFKSNSSLSSGTGGYIFDYDPEDELIVRQFINTFKTRQLGFKILVVDLFDDVLLPRLESVGLDEVFDFATTECAEVDKKSIPGEDPAKGIKLLKRTIADLVYSGEDGNIFITYIKKNIEPRTVIFLTGVGKCHPFIRSQIIIRNFNSKVYDVKTILMYPGIYDSEQLSLFGTMPGESEYRPMRLIPREVLE